MGADMIGFLVKGPKKLDESKIAEAKKKVSERLEFFQALDADGDERKLTQWAKRLGFRTTLDAREVALDVNLDGVPQLVEEFVEFWNSAAAGSLPRDTVSRPDPDDPEQVILFAGDRTWGDSPDGHGYRTLRQADAFDLTSHFGVR